MKQFIVKRNPDGVYRRRETNTFLVNQFHRQLTISANRILSLTSIIVYFLFSFIFLSFSFFENGGLIRDNNKEKTTCKNIILEQEKKI